MKFAIIGTGMIAKIMAKTVGQMKNMECYAVASRDLEKAKQFAETYSFQKAYGSYEEMLEDKEVELVYVATPHSEHYKHAKLCITHKKACLVEKPFMVNAKQAEEILKLAEEEQVFITEAMWTRFMPSRNMINEIISSDQIGEVTAVAANLGYRNYMIQRMHDPKLAGGALLDLGVYPLNFASMVLGNQVVKTASHCMKTSEGVDEQNVMILEYENGTVATLRSTMLSDTDQSGFVYGTKGYLRAKNINNVTEIEVYGENRELKNTYQVPLQITGYEYEVEATRKAIQQKKLECEEMSHKETRILMKRMDQFREDWGIKYPFE
jgi:predicted dehydrogenase